MFYQTTVASESIRTTSFWHNFFGCGCFMQIEVGISVTSVQYKALPSGTLGSWTILRWTILRPDNSSLDNSSTDNFSTGQFFARTILRPDNSSLGQFFARTILRPDQNPSFLIGYEILRVIQNVLRQANVKKLSQYFRSDISSI
jgi:hypothetical protein